MMVNRKGNEVMKKRLLLTAIATMMVATLLTGCGNTEQTDVEPTENTEVESIVESTESTETEIVEETESTEVVESNESETVETETPASEKPESEVVETTPEPEKPAYTYTDMDKTMYAKSSVNVRSLPSTDGEKLGGLSKAQEVHVTGQCNETSWYRIDYNGGVAYVSNSYLVNEKPVEETPAPEEPVQTSQPTVESFPYALLSPWYDATEDCVYYYFYLGQSTGYTYMDACDLLDQYTTKVGVHTQQPYFQGTYAEGDIYMSKVYIMPVN